MRDAKQRFSRRVDDYVRFRPSYPPGTVDLLVRECHLAPNAAVADVGSGTGILTRLFLDRGFTVFGVEPNREMREAAERLLAGESRFVSVDGAAEATTLASGSVALVTAGQAFHWFDVEASRRELSRILAPGGVAALIWNVRREEATPFMAGYEDLLRRFGTDYAQVSHRGVTPETLDAFFGAGGYEIAVLPNAQRFDYDGLEGRLLSASYVPARGEAGCEPMLADLRTLFERSEEAGEVTFEYETRIFYGRLG